MATFQKRAGNWRAIITRKGYPRVSRTFDTKAEAEAWATIAESEMARGVFIDRREAEATTLAEALDRYEREVTSAKKGASQERKRIAAWKRHPLAMRSLASIRGVDLAEWRDARLAAGASPTTARLDLALISHLYTVAAKEWGLESLANPVKNICLPTPARGRDRRLSLEELARLLAACDASNSIWLAPLVRLAIETGMRQGELLRLRWDDLDPQRPVARLNDTKNGEQRDVPLSSAALSVLKALPRSMDGRVIPAGIGRLNIQWRRALAASGIQNFRFHDLRHEATSRLFEKGFNPMEVATVTGHKTLTMLKRYTHLRAEDLAKRLG